MNIQKYIGLPYKDNGRDITGIDCWGLVRLYYKQELDIELPSYVDQYIGLTSTNIKESIISYRDNWDKVEIPQLNDLILFRILGEPTHIGLYLGDSKFLHIRDGYDSVIESINSINWSKRIEGYYRYRAQGFSLIGVPHPLNNYTIKDWGIEGSTVAQVVDFVQTKYKISTKLMERISVAVDGVPINKDSWNSTILKQGQIVTYRAIPGKTAVRTALMIAVIIAAMYVGGQVFAAIEGTAFTAEAFAASSFGTKFATMAAVAATQMAGAALVNAIAPIRPPKGPDDPGTPNSLNLFNGASNQANRFGAIPIILGKIRYTGLLGAVPYIQSQTSTSLFHSIIVWGFGPLDVEDICVGTKTIENLYTTPYTSTEAAQAPGIPPKYITLRGLAGETTTDFDAFYPVDVEQQYPGIELINNNVLFPAEPNPWTTVATSAPVDSIDLTFSFPEGMRQIVTKGNNSGQINEASASVEVQLRKWSSGGIEPWQNVSTHYVGSTNPGGTGVTNDVAFTTVIPNSWYDYTAVEKRYSICVAPGGGLVIFEGAVQQAVTKLYKSSYETRIVEDPEDIPASYYRSLNPVIPSGYVQIYKISVTGNSAPVVTDLRTNISSYQGFNISTPAANADNSGWIININSGKIISELSSQPNIGTETIVFQTSEFANVVEDLQTDETWSDFLVQLGYRTSDSSSTFDKTFTKNFTVGGQYTINCSATNNLQVYINGIKAIDITEQAHTTFHTAIATLNPGACIIRVVSTNPNSVAVAAIKITYVSTNTGNITATNSTNLIWGLGFPWAKYKDGFNDTYSITNLTRQRYEIRVRRTNSSISEPTDDVRNFHKVVLSSVTAYDHTTKPTINPPGCYLAKTAIRLQSTNTVNGTVDGINALVTSRAKDWNGTNWDTIRGTSNPASLFRLVLEHPANSYRITNINQLDLTQLQVWHDYCRTNNFEFNAVITDTKSVLDVLRDICAAGKASPIYVNGKWSVIIDKPRTSPVQYFTPHNSWGFEGTKVLPRIPHAFRAQFLDENNSYQTTEILIYNYGYNSTNSTLFEEINFPGVTKQSQVEHLARWHLAQLKLRPEIYTLNVDFEYLVCNRGDLVTVSHDIPMWGLGSGRLKSVDATGAKGILELTEQVYLEVGKSYSILIRTNNPNNVQIRKQLDTITTTGWTSTITLSTAIVEGDIVVDNLFMLGLSNSETRDLVVISVEPMDNYSARLTLVDYSPEIYTADLANDLLVYNSGITNRSSETATATIAAVPVISSLNSESSLSQEISTGNYANTLLVGFGAPEFKNNIVVDLTTATKIQLQIIKSDQIFSDSQLSGLYEIRKDANTLTITGLQSDTHYKVRARYTDDIGAIVGTWSKVYYTYIKGKNINNFGPIDVAITFQGTNIIVKPIINISEPPNHKTYVFRLYRTSASGSADFWNTAWDSTNMLEAKSGTQAVFNLLDLPSTTNNRRISSSGVNYRIACRALDNTDNYSTTSAIGSIKIQTIQ